MLKLVNVLEVTNRLSRFAATIQIATPRSVRIAVMSLEARNDYTYNSEQLFCVTDMRVIGKIIPRQLMCVLGTITESTS